MKTMFKTLWNDPAAARKAIAALIGAVLIAVSNGVLPPEVGPYVEVVVGFLTFLGVYAVHNKRRVTNEGSRTGIPRR